MRHSAVHVLSAASDGSAIAFNRFLIDRLAPKPVAFTDWERPWTLGDTLIIGAFSALFWSAIVAVMLLIARF